MARRRRRDPRAAGWLLGRRLKTRCLIWGAGAIGGTLGAYLARAGHDVTLVDTAREHVAAINRSGLTISGPIATFTTSLPAFTPDTLRGGGAWDTIILATKAHHTETAARALLPHLTPAGCVVSAQNGLNELVIAEVVGEARTVGAFVNFGADYLEPGLFAVTLAALLLARLAPSRSKRAPRPAAVEPKSPTQESLSRT